MEPHLLLKLKISSFRHPAHQHSCLLRRRISEANRKMNYLLSITMRPHSKLLLPMTLHLRGNLKSLLLSLKLPR